MKTSHLAQAPERLAWQWPLMLEAYNRDPQLSEAEKQGLAAFMRRPVSSPLTPFMVERLHRLIQPLSDALTVVEVTRPYFNLALFNLLRHMALRQTAFWAWSEEEWLPILGKSHKEFRQNSVPIGNYRHGILSVSYLLCDFSRLPAIGFFHVVPFATRIFGQQTFDASVQRVATVLLELGHGQKTTTETLPPALAYLLLMNRSPHLEDLTRQKLEQVHQEHFFQSVKSAMPMITHALAKMGILAGPFRFSHQEQPQKTQTTPEVETTGWASWCTRWEATSTLAPISRRQVYNILLQTGRWLKHTHPECESPAEWTYELAAECVAMVDRMTVGQWSSANACYAADKRGKPFAAKTKDTFLSSLRVFFRDCQEWNWIPRRFDPGRALATPRSAKSQMGHNPRVIADDIWAKLLWAGLNLQEADLPTSSVSKWSWYPIQMVRAIAMLWLFAGLRANEIRRLPVGCIRWQREDVTLPVTNEPLPKDAICWLDVPINKTGPAFTKAVDRVVGEAIAQWEAVRPAQVAVLDPKTAQPVHFLFSYRCLQLGESYLNKRLIPLLCRKAGIPTSDARGDITSHRARSTIANMLYNAPEPLTLFELQQWLGHRSPAATQYYVTMSPTKVAKKYEQAGYFQHNIRLIDVLINQEAIKSGAAAQGTPWMYYDLGHGYCTYDFFDQCPHRMACAKCAFYVPKGASLAQIKEGRANLLRMKQEIPLTEAEMAAVEDGMAALEALQQGLADVPTPAGPTPRQLHPEQELTSSLIPLESLRPKRAKAVPSQQ